MRPPSYIKYHVAFLRFQCTSLIPFGTFLVAGWLNLNAHSSALLFGFVQQSAQAHCTKYIFVLLTKSSKVAVPIDTKVTFSFFAFPFTIERKLVSN
jgi:hypothetical protein